MKQTKKVIENMDGLPETLHCALRASSRRCTTAHASISLRCTPALASQRL